MNNSIGWNFDNSFYKELDFIYQEVAPEQVPKPELVIFNQNLAKDLKLDYKELQDSATSLLSGNHLPDGAKPIAQAYAGHQFGYFNVLGDGRAVLLGEHLVNKKRYDIQFKGSGKTKYSRGGDGKAVLGPMLREYIISEAMYHLGIPTTRSLAVLKTGEPIWRKELEKGAILTRVASSHIRVGTFELVKEYNSLDELQKLGDYTIKRHYPELEFKDDKYLLFLRETISRQAKLIAKWQLVGFIHGVMNTDNMLVSGESIDYGPCAFMDTYKENTWFSSIDRNGRYAYNNQPNIGMWNLSVFAYTLLPLIAEDEKEANELAKMEVMRFKEIFAREWTTGMRKKLGLFTEHEDDYSLIRKLLELMEKFEADFTNTFRGLTRNVISSQQLYQEQEFKDWYQKLLKRRKNEGNTDEEIKELMMANNPVIIPRNYIVEECLKKANQGDYSLLFEFVEKLSNPFDYNDCENYFTSPPPETFKDYQTYCGT